MLAWSMEGCHVRVAGRVEDTFKEGDRLVVHLGQVFTAMRPKSDGCQMVVRWLSDGYRRQAQARGGKGISGEHQMKLRAWEEVRVGKWARAPLNVGDSCVLVLIEDSAMQHG